MQLTDGRDQTQHNTFCRWIQLHLKNTREPERATAVTNLGEDLKNGEVLCLLAESLVPVPIMKFRKGAKNDLVRQQNVTMALEAFEHGGCPLVNIHSSTISKGEIKATLGMCWQLILHYSISSQVNQESSNNNTNLAVIRQEVLDWVNQQLATLTPTQVQRVREELGLDASDSSPIQARNLDSSWSDGSVLYGLTISLHPSPKKQNKGFTKIGERANQLKEGEGDNDTKAYLNAAIERSEQCLGVPPLMSADDLIENPEANSILTLATYYKNSSYNDPEGNDDEEDEEEQPVEDDAAAATPVDDAAEDQGNNASDKDDKEEAVIDWVEVEFLEREVVALESSNRDGIDKEMHDITAKLEEYEQNLENGVEYKAKYHRLASRMRFHLRRLQASQKADQDNKTKSEELTTRVNAATTRAEEAEAKAEDASKRADEAEAKAEDANKRADEAEADKKKLAQDLEDKKAKDKQRLKRFVELEESLLKSAEIVDKISKELDLE